MTKMPHRRRTWTWAAPSPLQNCPFPWGIWTHLIHGSLGPPEITTQMASRSVQRFLQGSRSWQTDKPRYNICNNRPHLASAAMQPNNTLYKRTITSYKGNMGPHARLGPHSEQAIREQGCGNANQTRAPPIISALSAASHSVNLHSSCQVLQDLL